MANEFVAKNGLISQNNTIVSGSLTVTQGVTGSFSGSLTGTVTTASFATTAQTASYITSSNIVGTVLSASYAITASYALASAGGGVTSIIAGTGISVNQSTGDVTITNTGGAGGGISQGQVVAIAIGYSNLF